jgi:phage tail-like protein
LDSRLHQCPWHTITVELDELPRGSRLALDTYTANDRTGTFQLQPAQWDATGQRVGDGRPGPIRQTFLVQSRPGRFFRLRLRLWGDGHASPLVRRLRIDFPRNSWLRYLPAEYQRDEAGRQFLERFLAIAQADWDAIEARVTDFAALADPRAAPDEWLDYLASWLGLPLEGTWTPDQKRTLLVAAPAILARHGTADGLRDYLRVYLANMTGLPAEHLGAFPVILEGYRTRPRAVLPGGDALRFGLPLWGPAVIGRLQLDVFAVADEVALVATGDPQRDLFHHYAHRFRVLVPAAWVRDEAAERMLRRAIDAAKPAHTTYELTLLPSQVVLGRHSTLGVDMIIGRRPPTRLGGVALGEGALPDADAAETGRLAPGLRLGE